MKGKVAIIGSSSALTASRIKENDKELIVANNSLNSSPTFEITNPYIHVPALINTQSKPISGKEARRLRRANERKIKKGKK